MNRKFQCIFDTNIFNRILDFEIQVETFSHRVNAYVTHIQRDEINNTRNDKRRATLANIFVDVIPGSAVTASHMINASPSAKQRTDNENIIPTRSAVWGVSKWDQSMWAEDDFCMTLKLELDKIKRKQNNIKDALIADTAIKEKYVLVTDDGPLKIVTEQQGGECWTLKEMLENIALR